MSTNSCTGDIMESVDSVVRVKICNIGYHGQEQVCLLIKHAHGAATDHLKEHSKKRTIHENSFVLQESNHVDAQ